MLADANDNGIVDAADYTVWRDAFESASSLTGVPEPGAVVLLAIAAGSLLARRRV